MKSVHICQSSRKNNSGTIFYGPRCSTSSAYSQTYGLNVCSIAKPHAFQQILTDVVTYKPDVVILADLSVLN